MRAIWTTRAALGRRRTTTASLAWYMIAILWVQLNAQRKCVSREERARKAVA
jgi:hypothetical protein